MAGDAVSQQGAGGAIALAGDPSAPGRMVDTGRVTIQPALKSLRVLAEVVQLPRQTGKKLTSKRCGILGGAFADGEQVIGQPLPVAAILALGRMRKEFHDFVPFGSL
ncbi:hypothetical protein XAXN_19395 [Xanthomonas axonopodis]|uniref:Uncharacterized protein n=1 Tax=Xanthomonas axonopodis TaxID=53413 RepID=A0A0P6V684_9XANT|nr:hypothetical protein XAXN_19395 [Xanthomonas axonopodis]